MEKGFGESNGENIQSGVGTGLMCYGHMGMMEPMSFEWG